MLTEEEIIKGCKEYSKAAQMALYKQYAGKMNSVSFRYTNSMDDAKDIVQNGFIKIFESIKVYKGDGPLEGWIRRIIVNLSLDFLKQKSKTGFVSLNESMDETFQEEEYDDENILRQSYSIEELYAVIGGLPDMYKIIFNMHCLEEYSHKDIAEILNIKEATSRSRLRFARMLMVKQLEEMNRVNIRTR